MSTNGPLDRAEDRAVHHGERVGHRERRGRDHRKDGDRERNREQSDRSDRGFDLRLISDDQEGQQERARQKAEGAEAPENPAQTGEAMLLRVVITVLCGVGLYASLFMLAKTRRAELGLLERAQRRPAARGPALRRGAERPPRRSLLSGAGDRGLARTRAGRFAYRANHRRLCGANVGGPRLLSALHHQAPVPVLLDRARGELDSCYDSASSKRTYCLEGSRLVECVSPVGAADFGSLAGESGTGRVAVVPVSGERQ